MRSIIDLNIFHFRNIFRVLQSCWIVSLAKLIQTEWLFKIVYQLPPETEITEDLGQAAGLPVTCQILCTGDHFLMSMIMFYIATLAIYVFCRPAHPDFPNHFKKVIDPDEMNLTF